MAFSPQEQEIIRYGAQNGKSRQEVELALMRLRTGITPPPKPAETTQSPTYTNQVKEAASAGLDKMISGLTTPPEKGAIATPVGNLENAAKIGAGAVEVATSPLAPLFSPVGKFIGYIASKFGDQPAVQDFANSKAGEITSRVAEDVGNVAELAGGIAGVKGVPKVASAISDTATNLSKVAQSSIESLSGITDVGTTGIQKALSSSLDPNAIMQRVARIPAQKQAAFKKLTGKDVGTYLVDNGIFGNTDEIVTQLFDRFQKSKQAADNAFASLDERTGLTYKYEPVKTALEELFAREKRISTAGAQSPILSRIGELRRKYDSQGLNQTEINEVKRLYERNVKVDYLKENKPESVARATNLDTSIRNWQRDIAQKNGLTNIQEINKETQSAKQLLDDLGTANAASAANNAITLTDWILISGLDPTAIGAFLTKKTLSSKGIQSMIAKKLAGSPEQPDIFPIFDSTQKPLDSYGEWIKSIEGGATK